MQNRTLAGTGRTVGVLGQTAGVSGVQSFDGRLLGAQICPRW